MRHALTAASFAALLCLASLPALAVGDCSKKAENKKIVDSLCHNESNYTCTKAGGNAASHTAAAYQVKYDNATKCRAAREYMFKCYADYDKGHKDAMTNVGLAKANCNNLLMAAKAAEKRAAAKK